MTTADPNSKPIFMPAAFPWKVGDLITMTRDVYRRRFWLFGPWVKTGQKEQLYKVTHEGTAEPYQEPVFPVTKPEDINWP